MLDKNPESVDRAMKYIDAAFDNAVAVESTNSLKTEYQIEALEIMLFCAAMRHHKYPSVIIHVWNTLIRQFYSKPDIFDIMIKKSRNKKERKLYATILGLMKSLLIASCEAYFATGLVISIESRDEFKAAIGEISNDREINEVWRHQLNLDRVFDEVKKVS